MFILDRTGRLWFINSGQNLRNVNVACEQATGHADVDEHLNERLGIKTSNPTAEGVIRLYCNDNSDLGNTPFQMLNFPRALDDAFTTKRSL